MPLNRIVRTYGRRAERKALESSARSKARQQFQMEAMDDACPASKADGGCIRNKVDAVKPLVRE